MPINKMDHSVNRMLSFVDKVCYARDLYTNISNLLSSLGSKNEIIGFIRENDRGKSYEQTINHGDSRVWVKNILMLGLQKKKDELLKELEGYNKRGYTNG